MACNKSCDCLNCEMLERNAHMLFIDDTNPFNEVRLDINGFHCMYTGKYDVDTYALKRGGFIDDMVYASQNAIAINYIKLYTQNGVI